MEPHPDSVNWEQMQWVFTIILGGFSTIYGAILTYVFKELERLHSKDDDLVKMLMTQNTTNEERSRSTLDAFRDRVNLLASREEIAQLRSAIEEDRKSSSRDRENIAVMMATKEAMQQQFERFASRIINALKKGEEV